MSGSGWFKDLAIHYSTACQKSQIFTAFDTQIFFMHTLISVSDVANNTAEET